ncbi:hypothetical protein Tco_1292626 [Tanacetum coccineum]
MTDYALWELILNGDSPLPTRTVDYVVTSVPSTTAEQKLARKNELKARGTLLMALPNEHQLKFKTYKSAKTLMEAIEKRFGGNKESKKVQKTLLKQHQLEIHGETISQEDVNLKLLRSPPSEWKTHTLIWWNKPNLEDLSMDDLYNNLEIYEAEIMGSSSTNQNTQNIAFVSSNTTSSTNEAVKTAHGVSAANSKNNASTLPNIDSLSDAMIYSFFASHSNSSQLDNKDLKQVDPENLEEMDLKWQMAMLIMRARRFIKKTRRNLGVNGTDTIGFDKTKVECYNFHRRGHFSRECRAPKNQDNRNRETIRTVPVEETTSNALVSQCNGFGYDWSDQAEEGPTNFALMAYTSSSSSISDTKVSTCSKACLKSYETLKEHYDNLIKDFNKSQLNVGAYKAGLESIKARLDVYKKNEVVFVEDIKILKLDIMLRDNALTEPRKKFEKAKKERDDLKLTLEKFENSSKNLTKLLDSQICDKFKSGVGYKTDEGYHAVPPPYIGNFMPPKLDFVLADKDEYVFSKSATSVPSTATTEVKTSDLKPKSVSEPLIEDWISDSENKNETEFKSKQKKPSFAKVEFVKSNEHVKSPRQSFKKGNPQLELQDKGVIDSGCSRHMTGNRSYLSDYEEIDGGFVAFGGSTKGGKITGKGKIRIDFKLTDESHVLLKNSRKLVVTGNQSNGNAGTKACDDAGKARVETIPGKDYILLPLWPQDPQFSSSSKDFPNVGFKPSREEEKKDAEDLENKYSEVLSTEEPRVNQEKDANINSTNNINTVSPTINAAGIEDNAVDENIVYGCANDPNMPNLEEIIYSDDDEDNDAEADMNNLNTIMFVSPIPTTRLHKDHPLEQIIGDIHSAP